MNGALRPGPPLPLAPLRARASRYRVFRPLPKPYRARGGTAGERRTSDRRRNLNPFQGPSHDRLPQDPTREPGEKANEARGVCLSTRFTCPLPRRRSVGCGGGSVGRDAPRPSLLESPSPAPDPTPWTRRLARPGGPSGAESALPVPLRPPRAGRLSPSPSFQPLRSTPATRLALEFSGATSSTPQEAL